MLSKTRSSWSVSSLFFLVVIFLGDKDLSSSEPIPNDEADPSFFEKENCRDFGTEDEVNGNKIRRFPTNDILLGCVLPPTKFPNGDTIPSHLQYTVYLDQAGVFAEGLSAVDPEAAVVLSTGVWSDSGKSKTQSISRCYGGGWIFFFEDVKKIGTVEVASSGGKGMFSRLLRPSKRADNYCNLNFEWNEKFTKAVITGYMEERLRIFPGPLAQKVVKLTIELMPYWAWKFGLSGTKSSERDENKFVEMDVKCCPPKSESRSCLGPGTIGKLRPECETISDACGNIDPDDMEDCSMWLRDSLVLGKRILSLKYYAYPIGDTRGNPTGYSPNFLQTLTGNGVENVFYGITEEGEKVCSI